MNNLNLPEIIEKDTFAINNFDVQVYTSSIGDYLLIEDFWTYPDKIHDLALKIPTVKLQGSYDTQKNGVEYYDGRSHFMFYEKPLFINVLEDVVNKCFNLVPIPPMDKRLFSLSNNIFTITPESYEKYKNCYYGPHTDGDTMIACISYMNKEYSSTDGTAIFDRHGLHKSLQPWVDKCDVNQIGFLPAKYNRVIIYDGSLLHASTINSRWTQEARHTMVYFMDTYK